MKSKIPEWVMIDGNTGEAVCERCGTREKIPLPMPVTAFTDWAKSYGSKHLYCKEKGNGDAMKGTETVVDQDYVETSRIGEAAFLRVRGHQVNIESRGNMFVWVIPDSEKLRADRKAYEQDAPVPVKAYNEAIKELRTELQNLRRGQ